MGMTCRACEAEWEHCHGTVIRHSLRHSECTDFDCAGSEVIPHALVIDCDALGCECGQPMGSGTESAAAGSTG